MKKWSPVQAIFFSSTVLTTIGRSPAFYRHLSPPPPPPVSICLFRSVRSPTLTTSFPSRMRVFMFYPHRVPHISDNSLSWCVFRIKMNYLDLLAEMNLSFYTHLDLVCVPSRLLLRNTQPFYPEVERFTSAIRHTYAITNSLTLVSWRTIPTHTHTHTCDLLPSSLFAAYRLAARSVKLLMRCGNFAWKLNSANRATQRRNVI